MSREEMSVLIIGGGVAALSAAAAFVEQNKKAVPGVPRFKITVATSDEIWGGRASSWAGGGERLRYERRVDESSSPVATLRTYDYRLEKLDFRMWPDVLPLNHGFHAVFDESTYTNFWHTLKLAGLQPEDLKGRDLISNDHEILVYESETRKVCRLKVRKLPWPFSKIPLSHLAFAALELLRHGGWSLGDIWSFGSKVMPVVHRYRNDFQGLAELDEVHRVAFEKWCRDRGVATGIFDKMMFKFLFQGTYIAPNTMDATSGIMGLWTILRDKEASHWHYINGGITEKLMDPIAKHLENSGVRLLKQHELKSFRTRDFSAIDGCVFEPSDEASEPFDFYVSTLPLDSIVPILKGSTASNAPGTLLDLFPDVAFLERDKRFSDTAGTVNLQAWFSTKGLLADGRRPRGDYRNVIAGLEPLCVAVDYKNVLPMYADDSKFPGSVLEINGSLQELQAPEHYGYFECDPRFGNPQDSKTIEFAKTIMIDIARRYGFDNLRRAVERDEFLEWGPNWENRQRWEGHGDKIPPFLWKNTDPYNRFFVTGPGTLGYRPWIHRRRYGEDHAQLRKKSYSGPLGYPANFFFAGDWTRNGFDTPCMEGAARSGRMAALAIVKAVLGQDPTADPREREPTEGDPNFIDVIDPN